MPEHLKLVTEETAIRLCLKHRDPSGFEFLVRKFRREAYYHAHALLGNEPDAADACQESFANAFAAMPGLSKLDKIYPWFYRILRNRCLNMLGGRQTRDAYAAKVAMSPKALADTDDPSDLAMARESREQVWHLLSQLKPKHAEILTLKYIHGFRYDEISETLNIPRGLSTTPRYRCPSILITTARYSWDSWMANSRLKKPPT